MKSSFQTILVIVFAVVFGAAVLIFSGLINIGGGGTNTTTPQGTVVIWGIIPDNSLAAYLNNFNIGSNEYTISYAYHSPETLEQDLIVALANDTPPDLVIYSSELFSSFKDKLYTVPYAAYSERMYRDTNVDGAQVFLSREGLLGFPLVVDPLVVYYNKDILSKANLVVPPTTWSAMQQTIRLLTTRDARNGLVQTTIGLGTALNVDHAKDILSALFLQTGNSIITFDPQVNKNAVVLAAAPSGISEPPTAQALKFYTSFSDPTNSNYSWNNALPSTRTQFLASRSAFYIGRASELFLIQSQNPNLNFDVSPLFQTDADARPVTFGSYLAVGMMKNAPNPVAAYAAATFISSSASIDALSKSLSLPPVRRDLLQIQQSDPYVSVFFRAALSTFAWPDPQPARSDDIFRTMIVDVTSGKSDPTTAVNTATRELQSILR